MTCFFQEASPTPTPHLLLEVFLFLAHDRVRGQLLVRSADGKQATGAS